MNDLAPARFSYTVFNLPITEQIGLAALAEELGFEAVWLGEHIVVPAGAPSVYMPEDSDEVTEKAGLPRSIYDEDTRLHDLITIAGVIASKTQRISVNTGIYLAPFRHPLMTARSLTTLVEVMGGRFQFGLGAGWNKGEFDALGVPFEQRGSLLDETIDVLKAAMRGGVFEHRGRHFTFGPVQISQHPFHVPIIIGGHSVPALRRAARVGDGWISSISNDISDVLRLKDRINAFREEMGTADRPFQFWLYVNSTDPKEIARLRRLGVDRFVLYGEELWGPGEPSFETRCQRLRHVAADLRIDRQ